MKSYISVIVVAVILIGATLFLKTQNNTSPEVQEQEEEVGVQYEELDTREGMSICFSDRQMVEGDSYNTSNTRELELTGGPDFYLPIIKIPAEAGIRWPTGGTYRYTVVLGSNQDGEPYNVFTIDVYDLAHSGFRSLGAAASGHVYEGLSDRWYRLNYANRRYEECVANAYGHTDSGDPIYLTGTGDAGYMSTRYLVRMEDPLSGAPYLIDFNVSNYVSGERADGSRYESKNYEDYSEVGGLVEDIIRTLHWGKVKG